MTTIVYHNRWHRISKTIPWAQLQKHIRHSLEGYAEAIEQAYRYQASLTERGFDEEHERKFKLAYDNCDWLILDLIGHFESEFEKTGQWNAPERKPDDLQRGEA